MTVERYGSGGPWEEKFGYSRVVRTGDTLLTAGCTATVDGVVTGIGDPYAQALTAFGIALDALGKAGATAADVVRTRMYVTNRAHVDRIGRAHGSVFGDVRPVTTMVIVAGLIDPAMLIEVELEAYVGGRPRTILV